MIQIGFAIPTLRNPFPYFNKTLHNFFTVTFEPGICTCAVERVASAASLTNMGTVPTNRGKPALE